EHSWSNACTDCSKELTDGKIPVPFPVFLPVNYEVRDADYLFLKEAGQDFMRNFSMQSHTQPFVILRASRQPAVNASYGTMSTEKPVPLDLVQSVQLFNAPEVFTFNWKIQAFVLTPRVFSSKPKVRVLFYVAGRDWSRRATAVDELPCVTQQQAEYVPVTPMQRIGSVRLLQVPKGMATLSRLKLGNTIVIRTSSKPLKKTDIATFYILMDTEILNTAVLTGKKVVMPVRTVAVEEDGVVTDVSDYTDCSSTDEDVLKVSDRCDYVFVSGKETKGKVKMMVNFTYSYLSAQLELNVWMPQLPLQIEASDTELSQIKSWRVPILTSKRSGWNSEEDDRKGKGCMLQFQHALVRVLTSFVAEQGDPRDPKAYFLGSDWQVDVTRLVRYFMKVEDPRVARLQAGRVLSGRDLGTTTIQVFSPLSDAILGKTTIKVVDDKVTITELGVQLVTGLSMTLQLSPGSNRAILATTTTQEVLQSPKQEALVSAWIQFSDGNQTPLDIYDPAYHRVTVTSLDQGVVSVQGTPPAVVAEGEGEGVLVRVEMSICEACQKSKRKSTVTAAATTGTTGRSWTANGGRGSRSGPLTRTERRVPSAVSEEWARPVEIGGEDMLAGRPLTDLEIGMYALLGVFCLAILVFLVNCISYVVKFRHKKPPSHGQEPTGHRHDWVWLGTDAELVMSVPGSPVQQDSQTTTTVIDIGPDKTASLSRRPSCLTSVTDSPLSCVGSLRSKPLHTESLHSPTSKRKRVQFTTFSSLERQHSPHIPPRENGHGIHWVGKEDSCGEQPQPPNVDAACGYLLP
uniref:Transmembrane protein 132D n=1 Tax=Salarias fasciatus TaxID=181472 RepID=A0A672JMD1_SALFA